MKRKPSTKSDSYKCRIIRLLKMNRLYWKTTVFFFSLNGEADTRNRLWNVKHDYAIYTLQILPDSRSKEKKGKERKKKSKEKQKKKWNGDIRLTTACSACRSGCGPGL